MRCSILTARYLDEFVNLGQHAFEVVHLQTHSILSIKLEDMNEKLPPFYTKLRAYACDNTIFFLHSFPMRNLLRVSFYDVHLGPIPLRL